MGQTPLQRRWRSAYTTHPIPACKNANIRNALLHSKNFLSHNQPKLYGLLTEGGVTSNPEACIDQFTARARLYREGLGAIIDARRSG
jgi:hypothetical protein